EVQVREALDGRTAREQIRSGTVIEVSEQLRGSGGKRGCEVSPRCSRIVSGIRHITQRAQEAVEQLRRQMRMPIDQCQQKIRELQPKRELSRRTGKCLDQCLYLARAQREDQPFSPSPIEFVHRKLQVVGMERVLHSFQNLPGGGKRPCCSPMQLTLVILPQSSELSAHVLPEQRM